MQWFDSLFKTLEFSPAVVCAFCSLNCAPIEEPGYAYIGGINPCIQLRPVYGHFPGERKNECLWAARQRWWMKDLVDVNKTFHYRLNLICIGMCLVLWWLLPGSLSVVIVAQGLCWRCILIREFLEVMPVAISVSPFPQLWMYVYVCLCEERVDNRELMSSFWRLISGSFTHDRDGWWRFL